MGISSSIKVLLKTALVNYFVLLTFFIIAYHIDEMSRSQSNDDMGGVFYVIIFFTAYYWTIGTLIYLTIGLMLQRLMLNLEFFKIKHIRNFALFAGACLAFPIIFLGGPLEVLGAFITNSLFFYFTAWLVRRFTLKKLGISA